MEVEKIGGLPEIEKVIKINENEFKHFFKNQEFLEITLNENSEITHISGNIKEIDFKLLLRYKKLLPAFSKSGK